MTSVPGRSPTHPSRDWCATTFVVWNESVMLHRHARLGLWLPCGGHVEPNELPDEAAVRETFEESGVLVDLVGERTVNLEGDEQLPTALVRPRGVQLERIEPGHEHVDLIYFAVPRGPYDGRLPERSRDATLGWYDRAMLHRLDLTDEVRAWCDLALVELARPGQEVAVTAHETDVRTLA